MIAYSIKSTFLVVVFIVHFCHSQLFNGFNEKFKYKINWPGKEEAERFLKEHKGTSMDVKTAIGETYRCYLPLDQDEENKEFELSLIEHSPLELLSPLFFSQSCSYRISTYWIYEICHYQYVRQYHNSNDGRRIMEQEYYLGRWKVDEGLKRVEIMEKFKSSNYHKPTKTRKIEGVNSPYFEMNLFDGTVCDISGHPRQTNVLYICYPKSIHFVHSVKETSTCQYEVIILTNLLCPHPWYKPPKSNDLSINCLPIDDSPRKPHNLKVLESDTLKLRKKTNRETKTQSSSETESTASKKKSYIIIHTFMYEDVCLHGGTGRWTFEICYNDYIKQVHREIGQLDESFILGIFNKQDHINWINKNEKKRPNLELKGTRKVIYHFYSSGSICEKTGEPRVTEVRYKCTVDSDIGDDVELYLSEPKPCKYVLTIKSPALCELINGPIDEYGLFKVEDKKIDSIKPILLQYV